MLTVETIARIRREHAKGRSIRAIARSLKVSRETVTKYLRSVETAPRDERQHQPLPKLAAFQEELERLVIENERQPARDRLDYLGIFGRLKDAEAGKLADQLTRPPPAARAGQGRAAGRGTVIDQAGVRRFAAAGQRAQRVCECRRGSRRFGVAPGRSGAHVMDMPRASAHNRMVVP